MSDQPRKQSVIVTDFHMPFLSMVVFMVKWAIAAIPAIILLMLIGAITWSLGIEMLSSLASSRQASTTTPAQPGVPQVSGSNQSTANSKNASNPQKVAVRAVTVGKAIGPDKKVTAPTNSFGRFDTIYASVETTGIGNATLTTKWTFHRGDRTADVSESTESINAAGPVVTAFHVQKPSGWPPGDYQVAVLLNGKLASTQRFMVP